MADLRKIDAVFLLAYEFGQDVYEVNMYTVSHRKILLTFTLLLR